MFNTELSDGSKWELIYYQKHEVVYKTQYQYEPIPPVLIPVQIDNPNLIVQLLSPSSPTYWRYAGHIEASVNVPGISEYTLISSNSLQLNLKNYLAIPIETNYSLKIFIPWKFLESIISIWKFNVI